jgi:hypothetical protein
MRLIDDSPAVQAPAELEHVAPAAVPQRTKPQPANRLVHI